MTGNNRLMIKSCHFRSCSRCTGADRGENLKAPGGRVDRMRDKKKQGNAEETPLWPKRRNSYSTRKTNAIYSPPPDTHGHQENSSWFSDTHVITITMCVQRRRVDRC